MYPGQKSECKDADLENLQKDCIRMNVCEVLLERCRITAEEWYSIDTEEPLQLRRRSAAGMDKSVILAFCASPASLSKKTKVKH